MGAAVSSGRQSCGEHGGRLKLVDRNDIAGTECRVCQREVGVAAARVRRCRKPGCTFVLHDACYRLPVKIKRTFGRQQQQHRLALRAVHGAGSSCCSLCAGSFEPHALDYGCTDEGCGFRVHRRCCNLPQTMSDAALHEHGRLLLTSPSGDDAAARSRSCLKCKRPPAAWWYRCRDDSTCKGKICVVCVLGNDGTARRCGCGGVDVDPGRLGEWIGELSCGIVRAVTGCPGLPAGR